jgi:hypothetical protein
VKASRLRQGHRDCPREGDERQADQQWRERVREDAGDEPCAVDERRDAQDRDDPVPVGESRRERRANHVGDRDDDDHGRGDRRRAAEAPDDVEDDEARQAGEAELPERVRGRDGA